MANKICNKCRMYDDGRCQHLKQMKVTLDNGKVWAKDLCERR